MGGSGKGRARTLKGFGIGAQLRGGVSLAVLAGAGLLVAAPAAAQDAAAPADESAGNGSDIVVVGVRTALLTAPERKKNAEPGVDSCDETDIGNRKSGV